MLVEGSVTAVSWIPSEAVTGTVFRVPFEVGIAHYDEPPPDVLQEIESFLAADRARFVNRLHAWIEVRDGVVVGHGQDGSGRIGATTLRLGGRGVSFAAVSLPDRRRAAPVGSGAVRFEQTAGGRTGLPAPRRVSRPPYVQFAAPLAWTTLGLTLHADGSHEFDLAGASPFPRHWVYDDGGRLASKSATIDYRQWSASSFGRHSPWGDADSAAVVSAVESALERELSLRLMHSGDKPEIRRIATGQRLTEQGEQSDELYVLLDGVLCVDVDGETLAEIGPGAVLGQRAIVESGRRTATLTAQTPCVVAVADHDSVNPELLRELSQGHRREVGRSGTSRS